MHNLNENGTKQMDNVIEVKCFPTDVPLGDFHINIPLAFLNRYACGNFLIVYDISQDKIVAPDHV